MQSLPKHQIDPKAIKYWRWSGLLGSLFYWLIPVAVYLAIRFWNWPQWLFWVAAAVTLIITLLYVAIIPQIRWTIWRYEVSEEQIDLYHGVFIKHRTLIPMVRVQHVDTEQGPLMAHFRLSTVIVSTAAGKHEIPALADGVAADLREKISRLARMVDEDV